MPPSQLELSQIRHAASSVDSELDLMLALSEHVVTEPSYDELLNRLCVFAAELIGADLMLVPMLNEARDAYQYVAATGTDAELVLGQTLPITTGLCGWVLRHRRAVLHGDGHDLPFGEHPQWTEGMRSSLLVPLLSRGEIIGGLSGVGRRGGGSFTERDLKLLTLFANHTSVALSNALSNQALLAAKRRAEQHARELAEALATQKQLEDQLLHAQKMESMGRLAGGVAHDFNNILMTITGSLELAQMAMAEPEFEPHKVGALLEDAIRASDRAADLTKQLLAFARRQVIKPQPTNLGSSIDEAVSMLRRVLHPTIELRREVAPDLYLVLADPGQLNQILVNLSLNASDALTSRGRIDIRAFNRTLAPGELSSHDGPIPPGDYVVLVVQDDGSGIAPELLPRLFEPFFTTKAPGKGTGFGLAICYGIVRQLGGAIRVESQLGVGTRFELLFPRSHAELARSASPASLAQQSSRTIWVVDDDDEVRNMVSAALTYLGHTVHASPDGTSALAELSNSPVDVDLLITDILMPGLDGLQLVERLGDRRPGLPVLFMSGYPADHYRDLIDHAQPFLQKPFRPKQLAEQLRHLFSLQAQRC